MMRSGVHPANVEFTFRPIQQWDQPRREKETCRFRSTAGQTQNDLKCELAAIGVDECVIQADLDESQIRNDGMPYASAKFKSDRVIISFDHPEQGSVSFPCDTYDGFWNNVRGIVKTMESLRAVDRYGVTKNSQQYTGWKQLPSNAIVLQDFRSVEDAAGFIVEHVSECFFGDETEQEKCDYILDDHTMLKSAYRDASMRCHPDKGGSDQAMAKLNRARDMIIKHTKRGAA